MLAEPFFLPIRFSTLYVHDVNSKQASRLHLTKERISNLMKKRAISMIMALLLIVGIFVIQVAATSSDDGIEPYAKTNICPTCGSSHGTSTFTLSENVYKSCGNALGMHYHHITYQCTGFKCYTCNSISLRSKVFIGEECLG